MYDLSAVALSGGADSTALTYLLVQHAKSHQRDLRSILAVPIDHGLRPGSSAEAEKVSRWARSLGKLRRNAFPTALETHFSLSHS